MEDYQRSKQSQLGGGGGGSSQQTTSSATAASVHVPRVEPMALTAAVQQTVPLLLQAGEEVAAEP